MAVEQEKDHWSSDAYQKAAGFVPKLATKVVGWLDAQPDNKILDVGCGDGILTCHIARTLTTGLITGIDSSLHMITSAQTLALSLPAPHSSLCTFHVLDARSLPTVAHADLHLPLHLPLFDKVFSNAALHWILCSPSSRDDVFKGIHHALAPGGMFVFEMGGEGNVAEMRGALVEAVARRVGIKKAKGADPWFFPSEEWMRVMLERSGFVVERMEMEERPTRVQEGEGGGVEGWVRLMGGAFFDVVGKEGDVEREECVREVVGRLERECATDDGGHVIGYVRLRALARKVG